MALPCSGSGPTAGTKSWADVGGTGLSGATAESWWPTALPLRAGVCVLLALLSPERSRRASVR